MLQADDTETKAEKDVKVAEARASFDKARIAYAAADERLKTAFAKYPPFLQDNDPRKDEKERTHTAMMQAELQKAVVDYEQGQTYPAGSKERTELMSKGLEQFETLYKRYRTQLAGLRPGCGRRNATKTRRPWPGDGNLQRVDGTLRPATATPSTVRRLVPHHHAGQTQGIRPRRRRGDALAASEQQPRSSVPRKGSACNLNLPKTSSQLPEIQNEKDKSAAPQADR